AATELRREYTSPRVQLWMGHNAHLVAYPISGGRQINVVAIVAGTWNRPGWTAPGEPNEIKQFFASARWPATARMLASAVDEWERWAPFTVPHDGEWPEGQIPLLGGAAHAMLPFAAQGAGMAIEDAAVLAKCLAEGGSDAAGVAAALRKYARQRRGRVAKIQRLAARQGRIYHMSGPMAAARDLFIRVLGGKAMLSRQAWVYDGRVSRNANTPNARRAMAARPQVAAPRASPHPARSRGSGSFARPARQASPARVWRYTRCDRRPRPQPRRRPRSPPSPSAPAIRPC